MVGLLALDRLRSAGSMTIELIAIFAIGLNWLQTGAIDTLIGEE